MLNPRLEPQLRHLDVRSLQFRLVPRLGVAISLGLILVVALVNRIIATTSGFDRAELQAIGDLSFVLLIDSIATAIITGILVARWLTAPLNAFSRASDRLATGDIEAPLPTSGATQMQRLRKAFAEMRSR